MTTSQKAVTPAQAGVQGIPNYLESMDSGLRRNGATLRFAAFYDVVNDDRWYKVRTRFVCQESILTSKGGYEGGFNWSSI